MTTEHKPTKRRLELWMALLREGEYTHMVYDLTSEDCRWFCNEDDAKAYMRAVPKAEDVREKVAP
jgi:hypothetical protein